MAATYTHATAPLRRLADRYVVRAALAVANDERPPDAVLRAFEDLPPVMARADARAAQLERAVIDLAEAVMLGGRIGEVFEAVVTDVDERGARIQLCDLPVVARVAAHGSEPGDRLCVRLAATSAEQGSVSFEHVV
jgi:exoribonuclease R